jgi:signal transduction histidine kinase
MWAARAVAVVATLLIGACGLAGAAAEGFAAAIAPGAGDAAASQQPLVLVLAGTLVGLGWCLVGAVLIWLRPANLVGWTLLLVGALTQLTMTESAGARAGWWGSAGAESWAGRPVGLALSVVAGWCILTMVGMLPAIYPDGRLSSRASAWPVIVVAIGAGLVQAESVTAEITGAAGDANQGAMTPGLISTSVYIGGAVAVWAMCIVRLLRSPPPKRQQLAWLLGSIVVLVVVNLLGDALIVQVLQIASLFMLPVAIAIGLLRYRLLGIDAAPRADPFRTVAEIGSQVASTEEGELLGAVLASVQRSVGAPGARVLDESGAVAASVGTGATPGFTADLAVGGTRVGVLEVGARWPGARYGVRDERMLRALAAQIAAVVRAQRLTEQVEAQRDAVVDARMQERERLRRELHDGLGPALTGMALGLEGLADAVRGGDGERSLEIADVLRTEVATTVSDVRRVLDDLRPAALDEGGFADAMRRNVAAVAATVPVTVRIGELPVLPLAVERAAYRVAAEAVANAARHAHATRLHVDVGAADGRLSVRVEDDGIGFDRTDARRGIGLASMHERAGELGGELSVTSAPGRGTTVCLLLPIGGGIG